MPTNLATLYALQNKTNPAREKAKMMAEGIKTIEPDKYGYSSIAKIPLMYMYGQAAGEASNIDAAQNEEISGLMKSTAEAETLKAKSEADKSKSEIAKNTSTINKQEVETAAKMLEVNKGLGKVSKEAQIAHINSPEVKAALRIPGNITITSIEDDETGTWSVFDAYDTTDSTVRKYLLNNTTGEIKPAAEGNKWGNTIPLAPVPHEDKTPNEIGLQIRANAGDVQSQQVLKKIQEDKVNVAQASKLSPVPTGPSESDITNAVRLKYGVSASPELDKTVLGYDANKSPITTGDEIASTLGDKYSNYQKDVSDANIQAKLKSGAGVAGILSPKPDKPDDWIDWGFGEKKNKQTGEIVSVKTAPKDNAITPQDRAYRQRLEAYWKYIIPAIKSDGTDEINRINNSPVGKGIKPEHLYTPNMDEGKKAGFWSGVKNFLGIGNDSATPTQPAVSPADAYAKGTPKKAVAPQKAVPTAKRKEKVIQKADGSTVVRFEDGAEKPVTVKDGKVTW